VSRRLRLADTGVAVVVAAAILAAASGSAIQRDLFHWGRRGRWELLAIFVLVALARAWLGRGAWRLRPAVAWLVGLVCALPFASIGWTVSVHATAGRSAAQLAALAGAAALAGCVPDNRALLEKLATAILAATGIVAVASLIYRLTSGAAAYQPADVQYSARFRGIEFNPNTLGMIIALGMPLATALALDAKRPGAARKAGAGLFALFVVELALSESRGGMLAGFGASLVVAVFAPGDRRRRLAAAATVCIAAVACAVGSTIPKPLPASAATAPAPAAKHVGIDAERVLPLEGEIGNPWWTHRAGNTKRTFFGTGVRAQALVGSLHRWLQRPFLGFGYGAEIDAFVNRYYGFDSQNPENGYAGLLLQLGIVGLLVFVAAFAACLAAGVAACLRRPDATSAGIVGTAAAGVLLGLSQSYFHGPGGVGFLALWLSLLVAGTLDLSRARAQPAG
jgi:hypothetical protein